LVRGKKTRKVKEESRCIRKEQDAREKLATIEGRHRHGRAMREDAIIATMRISDQL
jgi:hypothetical protein